MPTYQPHQLRIINENNELVDKTTKLKFFIDESPIYQGLSEVEQKLLSEQLVVMQNYSDILVKRIELF